MDGMDFVKKALPWIGAAASGNVPALITMASQAVGSALGIEVAPEAPAIAQAVAGATTEQIMALRQADNDFALRMREFGYKEAVELSQVEAGDRASARDREAKTSDSTNRVLAYLIVAAFLTTVTATLMGWTKAESVLAGTLIGYLSAKADQVLSYYFGMNKNNARQTELLSQADAVKNPK